MDRNGAVKVFEKYGVRQYLSKQDYESMLVELGFPPSPAGMAAASAPKPSQKGKSAKDEDDE
jgi:hypothetical protein